MPTSDLYPPGAQEQQAAPALLRCVQPQAEHACNSFNALQGRTRGLHVFTFIEAVVGRVKFRRTCQSCSVPLLLCPAGCSTDHVGSSGQLRTAPESSV
eukprot:15480595-Alexandrium_andersonii.AAC.1